MRFLFAMTVLLQDNCSKLYDFQPVGFASPAVLAVGLALAQVVQGPVVGAIESQQNVGPPSPSLSQCNDT